MNLGFQIKQHFGELVHALMLDQTLWPLLDTLCEYVLDDFFDIIIARLFLFGT